MSNQLMGEVNLEWTPEAFSDRAVQNLYHTHGQLVQTASDHDVYVAIAYTVRDYLITRLRKTADKYYEVNPKFVYYLSAEFLLGKQLPQNMLYTDTTQIARDGLAAHGLNLEDYIELDAEPGLGNGGLGRLAACFMDSLATLDIPAIGYGIRYEFGIFRQTFHDGWQVEKPDEWLLFGNPWDFLQPDEMVEVGFGGHVEREALTGQVRWHPEHKVRGEPCTTLSPGYKTNTVIGMRLWRARATEEFDFELFDDGDYTRAVKQKIDSENITKVLYPNDETPQGRELRLKQQYFFVSCSLHDILRRFRIWNDDWALLPDKVVMQLNDTHPVIAIPELMRILVDKEGVQWDQAWEIARKSFAYTCHTLLPEALEKWPVELLGRLLPRHLEIIYEINRRFLDEVRDAFPGDDARVVRMSIVEEGPQRQIRMANLAAVGSFAINGVAELQSQLLRQRTLRDFNDMWPEKIQNKTNGVTPRRFMRLSNPRLSELITDTIGDGWLNDLERLRELESFADDRGFQHQWQQIKQQNKQHLADMIADRTGVSFEVESIVDVLAKRLHEYKRQLLKTMHIIWLYHKIKANPEIEIAPRTFLFAAKAAPGYWMAKRIIKLIHSVGEVVNHDADVRGRLTVVYPANFNVSMAEKIYPAANISEQISLAGKEASGTGNMKFALNGALTVGTLDGANVEIREHVGAENFFLFGLTTDQVFDLKESGYEPLRYYHENASLKQVVDSIGSGQFSGGDRELFRPIVDSLLQHDEYLLMADFQSYIDCSENAAREYLDQESWTKMSILNTARCGYFSSDRTIRQYCEEIWGVKPVHV